MWQDYKPNSIPEMLQRAWLKRTMSVSVVRELGPMHWSANATNFLAWEEPNFFVMLLGLREPVTRIARVDLTYASDNVPGPRRIHMAIVPPAGDDPVDNTPKYLAVEYTEETLSSNIDFVIETIVQLFRCIRQQWSWEVFHRQFQERLHAHHLRP